MGSKVKVKLNYTKLSIDNCLVNTQRDYLCLYLFCPREKWCQSPGPSIPSISTLVKHFNPRHDPCQKFLPSLITTLSSDKVHKGSTT